MLKKLSVFFFCLLLANTVLASKGDGGYAGAFMRMGFGARAKAMGDAFTAVPEGAAAALYNPSITPLLESAEFVTSFAFLPLDRNIDIIGFAMPISPPKIDGQEPPLDAGISVAWVHASVDNIDGRNASGEHTEYLSNSENAFYMSFAVSPSEKFSIGLSGKVLYNRMPGLTRDDDALTSSGFGLDFGVFSRPVKYLAFGVTLRDVMSKYTWNTDKVYERGTSTTYHFPNILRASVVYTIPDDWLMVSADIETSDKQNPRYHIGAEVRHPDIGALRLGWDHDTPTFGLGFFIDVFGLNTSVNYAYVFGLNALNADHVISWAFRL